MMSCSEVMSRYKVASPSRVDCRVYEKERVVYCGAQPKGTDLELVDRRAIPFLGTSVTSLQTVLQLQLRGANIYDQSKCQ